MKYITSCTCATQCSFPNMLYPSHSGEFHNGIANLKEGLLLKPLHMQLHNTLRLSWLPWWCAVTFFFEQCLICSKWGTGLCWVRLQLKTFGWNQTSCFFICEISWCPGLIDFSATTQMLLIWHLWFVAIAHQPSKVSNKKSNPQWPNCSCTSRANVENTSTTPSSRSYGMIKPMPD